MNGKIIELRRAQFTGNPLIQAVGTPGVVFSPPGAGDYVDDLALRQDFSHDARQLTHFEVQENFQKGPDTFAVIPGEDALLVIEYTTGLLDQKDKLAKLVQRTQALRDALARTGYPATAVYSVIVSALPRKHLAAHVNSAHDHGVPYGDNSYLRLPHHCNIVETGIESWLIKHREEAARPKPFVGQKCSRSREQPTLMTRKDIAIENIRTPPELNSPFPRRS